MTRAEAIEILNRDDNSMRKGYFCINDFEAIEVLKSKEPCEDCVSRKSLLDKLDPLYKEKIKTAPDNMAEGFLQVSNLIKYETSVTPTQRWIPVSERLPEESVDVICCTDAKEVFIASYLGKLDDGTECFDDDNGMMCEGDIVAWMPLPEPYEV